MFYLNNVKEKNVDILNFPKSIAFRSSLMLEKVFAKTKHRKKNSSAIFQKQHFSK